MFQLGAQGTPLGHVLVELEILFDFSAHIREPLKLHQVCT